MEMINPENLAGLEWRVAQKCNSGACVQVADGGNLIFLGDTKDPSGPVFPYTRPAWHDFITRVKHGDFDLF